jgi:hypothetical protein
MPLLKPKLTKIIEENDDYPILAHDDDLPELLSSRIDLHNKIISLNGQKKAIDGQIHEIVNNKVFSETPDSLKNGYTSHGFKDEKVQIQVNNRYSPIKCEIKFDKAGNLVEDEKKIKNLAAAFDLKEPSDDGTYPFPPDTFIYQDSIVVDPTKVEPERLDEFTNDILALGDKYSIKDKNGEVLMTPVTEVSKVVASPFFHKGRLKLSRKINDMISAIFQNISIKLINEKPEKEVK